jgi:ribosomal protein S24E
METHVNFPDLVKGLFMSTLEVLKDSENKLLSRRELAVVFKGGSGFVSRPAAAEAISSRLGVPKDRVKVISLNGKFGLRDLFASVYVYHDAKDMKKQIPPYVSIRELPKDQRKQAREALKPKPAAPGADTAKKS